jgi:hypothetical protein
VSIWEKDNTLFFHHNTKNNDQFFIKKPIFVFHIQFILKKYLRMTVNVFDEIVDFITSAPQPTEIANYRPSATVQAQLEILLYKKQNDLLSEEDSRELEQYMLIEHLMRMAKARAKQRMAA